VGGGGSRVRRVRVTGGVGLCISGEVELGDVQRTEKSRRGVEVRRKMEVVQGPLGWGVLGRTFCRWSGLGHGALRGCRG